jgi:hypothetical protein
MPDDPAFANFLPKVPLRLRYHRGDRQAARAPELRDAGAETERTQMADIVASALLIEPLFVR